MEHLKTHLDDSTSLIVFEFLINDDDYTPFRCEDIIKLENKITEWDLCLYWAIENNKLEIFSYIHLEIAPEGFINEEMWEKSMHVVAKSGNIPMLHDVLTINNYMLRNGVAKSAGRGGHLHMIQEIELLRPDNPSEFIFVGAGEGGHLNIFITYLVKHNPSVISDAMQYLWDLMINSIVKENHLHILEWIGEHPEEVKYETNWKVCVKQSVFLDRLDIFKYSLSKVSNMTDDKWKDITESCICGDLSKDDRRIPKNALKMLKLIGTRDEYKVNWTKCMNDAAGHGQLDTLEYSLSKGADTTKLRSRSIGYGGNIEIVKFIEHIINWNSCLFGAIEGEHMSIIKHALDRGANNWYECMITASREGYLSSLICIESEIKKRNIYITTAVYNKCMIKATCSGHIEIVKHVSEHSYNWNQCMRDAAYHRHFDILKYAECQDADDWKGTLKYINRFTPYNDEKIIKYLKSKISLYERCGPAKRRKLIN
uniref:Ankyrin repeat protein n=1 Tax=Pithovirus LCPAC406 TaxID=2506599 RepID=A0A481ZET3_9VIRU|nr:MAG: ankyrin repeat protein [Pithovirus LCPAC406]